MWLKLASAAMVSLFLAAAGGDATETVSAIEKRKLSAPLSVRVLDKSAGLPQSSGTAIVQDQQGFVWIGTQDGLARYDGQSMRSFRPIRDDDTSIVGRFITSLDVHPSGELWVGTDVGVSVYDYRTDTFRTVASDGVDLGGVNDVFIDSVGAVWLALSEGGVVRVDAESGTVEPHLQGALSDDQVVLSIDEDKNKHLWLGTNIGLLSYDAAASKATLFESESRETAALETESITEVLVAGDVLWAGLETGGLVQMPLAERKKATRARYDAENPRTIGDDRITALYADRAGKVWIGTENGLNRYDGDGFTRFGNDKRDPRSLSAAYVESLFQDAGGVYWVGLAGGGVCVFDDLRLKFGRYASSVATLSFAEGVDGSMWVGTDPGAGLYRFQPELGLETIYHSLGDPDDPDAIQLDASVIWALVADADNTLWIGTGDQGLIRYNVESGEYRHYPGEDDSGLESNWINDIAVDTSGDLWLATWGGGLAKFNPRTERFTTYSQAENPELSSNYIYRVYVDPVVEGELWLGMAEGGLCRFTTASGEMRCDVHDPGDDNTVAGNNVTSIYRRGDDLWVGTYGDGFDHVNLETLEWSHLPVGESSSQTVYGILPGPGGALWLSTTDGLFQFDPVKKTSTRYGKEDGLQSDEFTQGAFVKRKDGSFFFGGVTGFNVFDPAQIAKDNYVPPLAITNFRSFGEKIDLSKPIWLLPTIEVDYNSSFEFEFSALSYSDPAHNRYAYKLEGFNSDWIEGRRLASFGQLDGGDYTLRVRAATPHGEWNEGISLKLHVTPAPWKSKWAYGLYALIVVVIALLYKRYTDRRVEQAEQANRLAAVERDLELTGAVQEGFLPVDSYVEMQRLRLVGFHRPAETCSGDWWWYEDMGNGVLTLVVGDVTGHGPGPAMVTAAVATAFRVQAAVGVNPNFDARAQLLSQEVSRVGAGKYQMTMSAMEIDQRTGRYRYYSAGGQHLITLQPEARSRTLPLRGSPLGHPQMSVGIQEGQLQPGERILLYTDGIPEIELGNGRELGLRRFSKMFEDTRGLDLLAARKNIVDLSEQSLGRGEQSDDWTFAIVEWR